MKVKVTFEFRPEPDESDEDDRTGLTQEAHERLMEQLLELGAEETTIERLG